MSKQKRGLGLGTTLVVVALVATLGFVVTAASVSHLRLMSHTTNEAYALDLARSTVHLGIERIFRDRAFGTRAAEDRTLTVDFPDAPAGSRGVLTFDPNQAGAMKIPLSLNNLDGPKSQSAPSGQVVPTQAIYFVAQGNCKGVTRQLEVILYKPSFPYAAFSDGPIFSSGGLQVASRDAASSAETDILKMKPADLLSNATGSRSIVLGPDSIIHGDLRSSGQIQLDAAGGTRVLGQLWPNQDPRTVPALRAEDYAPGSDAVPLDSSYTQAAFTGKLRRAGNLDVSGDLDLQGALLYVEGDLTVNGGVKGSGVVVTLGKLTIRGQTEMVTADKVALLSKGGIELQGQGRVGSNLRGVIYTEGGLSAHQLRLEGALISRKSQQQVQLEQVSLLKDPSAATVKVTVPAASVGCKQVFFDSNHKVYPDDQTTKDTVQNGDYFFMKFSQNPDGSIHYHVCRNHIAPGAPGQILERQLGDISSRALSNPQDPVVGQMLAILHLTYPQFSQLLGLSQGGPGSQEPGSVITVDPSQLLPMAEALRITLWREN
jgi:hypothetical protein